MCQGDQIGRNFAYSVIVYFGQLQKQPKFFGNFFHGKSYVLILTENVFGYILGVYMKI
jgi:hypothetical protein